MKIVVSGYYGFGNAGDEALLHALLIELRRLRPDARLVVLSGDPADTAASHHVEAIRRTDPVAVLRSLRGARLFISGGGSLLQDATGPRTVPYYTGLIWIARVLRVPVFVYAQGLGPLRRSSLRRWVARTLRTAAEVTVRDATSAREALALGVDRSKIRVTADPVFALSSSADLQPSAAGRRLLSSLPAVPLIGLSVRPLQGPRAAADILSQRMLGRLQEQLSPLLSVLGARVLPLPLYPAQDRPLLDRLVAALGPSAVAWPADAAPERLTASDWLVLMGRLQMCVTMRLHGLIFAAAAGVPFVALADDPKIDAHVAELGLDPRISLLDASALVEEGDDFARLLERAWRVRRKTRASLNAVLPALAGRARETAARAIAVAERGDSVYGTVGAQRDRSTTRGVRRGEGLPGRTYVLGTPVDAVTMEDAVAEARRVIKDGRPAQFVTANPELVMRARRDGAVRKMLAEANLVVPDGIGIVAAASLLGAPVPERVPGVELMQALLAEGGKHRWRVYLLGGAPGVAEEAVQHIQRKWPGVHVVGARDGYFEAHEETAVVQQIVATRPDIVFVGMGAPRQELFIARQRIATGVHWNVPLAIGVGGSIDVLAGRVTRAPGGWQKLGLEWLYRLLRQPSRFKRAIVLPKFALLVLLHAARRNLL